MGGRTKAVLVVGGGLLLANLLTGVFGQVCPLILYSIGGVLVGLLAVQWADGRLENPTSEGAMAGLLAGLIGFGGQFVARLINIALVFAAQNNANMTRQKWSNSEELPMDWVASIGICACTGIAALVAKMAAERKGDGDGDEVGAGYG